MHAAAFAGAKKAMEVILKAGETNIMNYPQKLEWQGYFKEGNSVFLQNKLSCLGFGRQNSSNTVPIPYFALYATQRMTKIVFMIE